MAVNCSWRGSHGCCGGKHQRNSCLEALRSQDGEGCIQFLERSLKGNSYKNVNELTPSMSLLNVPVSVMSKQPLLSGTSGMGQLGSSSLEGRERWAQLLIGCDSQRPEAWGVQKSSKMSSESAWQGLCSRPDAFSRGIEDTHSSSGLVY